MSKKKTARPPDLFRSTFHRDGTVTVWSVFRQAWLSRVAPADLSDETVASLPRAERDRLVRLGGAR